MKYMKYIWNQLIQQCSIRNFHTPSSYALDNILAVGASDRQGKKAYFSNFGEATVDLLAPGTDIVSTDDGNLIIPELFNFIIWLGGAYAVVSGTSFASPIGAGAAALVWSRYPELEYNEIIDAIVGSCDKKTENKSKTENEKT